MWSLFFFGGLVVLALVALLLAQAQARRFVRRRTELAETYSRLSDADLKALLLAEPGRDQHIRQVIAFDAACGEAVRRGARDPGFWEVLEAAAKQQRGLRSRLAQAYLSQQRSQGL